MRLNMYLNVLKQLSNPRKEDSMIFKNNSISFAILVNYGELRLYIQSTFYINCHEKRLFQWHRV